MRSAAGRRPSRAGRSGDGFDEAAYAETYRDNPFFSMFHAIARLHIGYLQDDQPQALAAVRALPSGRDAAIIGRIQPQPQRVILRTPLGGERVIEELEDDPLPRIC